MVNRQYFHYKHPKNNFYYNNKRSCTWRLRDILVMPVLSAEISVAIRETSGDSLVNESLVEMMSLLTSVMFFESSLIFPSTFSTDFIWLFMVKMEFVRPDIPTDHRHVIVKLFLKKYIWILSNFRIPKVHFILNQVKMIMITEVSQVWELSYYS